MRKREEPSELELLQRQEEKKALLTAEVGALNIKANKLKGEIADLNKQFSDKSNEFIALNIHKLKLNEEIEAIKKVKQLEEAKLFDELNKKIKETDSLKIELNKKIEENKVASEMLAVSQADLALKQREIDLAIKDISEREEALKTEFFNLADMKNKFQIEMVNRLNDLKAKEIDLEKRQTLVKELENGNEDKLNKLKKATEELEKVELRIIVEKKDNEDILKAIKDKKDLADELEAKRILLSEKEKELAEREQAIKDNEKAINNRVKKLKIKE